MITIHDEIISDLITSARQRLEAFTGLSFIPKCIRSEPTCGVPELAWLSSYLRKDKDGTDYITTINRSLKRLQDDIVIEYVCGYAVLKKG